MTERRNSIIVSVLGIAAGLLMLALSLPGGATHTSTSTAPTTTVFNVALTGSQEVPPVATSTTGQAAFTVGTDISTSTGTTTTAHGIAFQLSVSNGNDITMAHIHCGLPGQNGPIVATLFGDIPGGFDVNGNLASFTLQNQNIQAAGNSCDPKIKNLTELWHAMDAGTVYVNAHNLDRPNGLIRGQIIGSGTTSPIGTTTPPITGTTTPPGTGATTGTTTAVLLQFIQELLAEIENRLNNIMNRVLS